MRFKDTVPATLDLKDTECLLEFMKLIPEKVYEQRDVIKEREKYLERKDQFEAISDEEMKSSLTENDEQVDFENEGNDLMLNLIQSLKSIDIIGQILRNRYGSLTKTQLKDLCKVAIDAGFKMLKFHLSFSGSVKNEILSFIEKVLQDNGKKKDENIIKEAKKIFLALNYGVAFGIIRKISKSIGSDAVISLLEEISEEYENSPAFTVMSIAVKLEFTNKIPKREIEKAYKDLDNIPITRRLLRDTIIQHAHLHHIDYQDRQWISNVVEVPMNSQRLIGMKVH